MKLSFFLVSALPVVLLSGCSWLTIGEENFACSGMPDDVKCMNTYDMYEYSLANPPENFREKSEPTSERTVQIGDDHVVQNFVVPRLPASPIPMRTPAMVMRIYIAPYEDINGDLVAPGYVYTEVESRRWITPNSQQDYGVPGRHFSPLSERHQTSEEKRNPRNSLKILAEKQRAKQ